MSDPHSRALNTICLSPVIIEFILGYVTIMCKYIVKESLCSCEVTAKSSKVFLHSSISG